jgi:hypothetical protein
MHAKWEAFLQHISICHALTTSGNPYLPHVHDLRGEIEQCINKLEIPEDQTPPLLGSQGQPLNCTRKLRDIKRKQELEKWTCLKVM